MSQIVHPRRSFLKGSLAAAAACAVPRSLPAGVSPNEKLNVAFVGAGGKGEHAVRTFGLGKLAGQVNLSDNLSPLNRLRPTALAILLGVAMNLCGNHATGQSTSSARDRVEYFGYSQCIELKNEHARVVLGPEAGARVLEYSWNGATGLHQDPSQRGWTAASGQPAPDLFAGRFDVGPERIIPKHPDLWTGPWSGEKLGPLSARMTSVKDKATGLQLTRDFTLDPGSSHLTCTQTIHNVSDRTVSTCHWSRTMSTGGGICLIPLTSSRFPKSYLMYGPGPVMNFQPEDPNIRLRDGFLEIVGPPAQAKLGFDSAAGWFCYLTRNDLMFVKRFPVYPDRVYNEMAGLTISIWYKEDKMCELEPIGPQEILAPGQSASFTEHWWLLPYRFPGPGATVDLKQITRLVDQLAR